MVLSNSGKTAIHLLLFVLIQIWNHNMGYAQKEVLDLEEFSAFKSGKQVYLRFVVSAGNTCEGIQIWRGIKGGDHEVIHEIPGVCGSDSISLTYVQQDMFPIFNQPVFYQIQFGGLGFSDTVQSFFINTAEQGHLLIKTESDWKIFFENPFSEEAEISIFDLQGRNWYNAQTKTEAFTIPANEIPNGVSFFWLKKENEGLFSQGKWLK